MSTCNCLNVQEIARGHESVGNCYNMPVVALARLDFLVNNRRSRARSMSYSREWDEGKDWDRDDHSSRGYYHEREEDDHYSDGKRRKYNNGVRIIRSDRHMQIHSPHDCFSGL